MPRTRHALAAAVLGGLALAGCTPAGQDTSAGQEPAASTHGTPGHQDGDTAGNAAVTTKLLEFQPEKLTVKAGTTVVWKVADGLGHTVTTGTFTLGGDGLRSAEEPDGVLDTPLAKGKTVSHTFDKPGTYTYYCSIHKGMNGEITVAP
jgi:plastocyanin